MSEAGAKLSCLLGYVDVLMSSHCIQLSRKNGVLYV